MITNIDEFVNSINYKGLNNRGSIYAQIIKGERIKQNKTLEEVASGICSISYLCKLENYMIYPPQNLVKAVFEKMNITYDEINEDNLEEILDNSIENYFFKQKDKIYEDYLKIQTFTSSPQVILVKCLYNLLNKDYSSVSEDVAHLDEIKDTLGGIESLLLILVTIAYYIGNNNYKKASMFLKCLDYIKIDLKYIKYIVFEMDLICSFHLRDSNRYLELYNRIDTFEYNGYPMSKRIINRLMYDILKYSDFPNEALIDCLSIDLKSLNGNEFNDVLYYKYVILINCNKYLEVFNEIMVNKYYNNPMFLGLMAASAFYMKQKEYFDKLVEFVNENNDILKEKENVQHKNFIYLVLMNGINSNKIELKEYIKSEILPFSDKSANYLYSQIFNEIYVSLLAVTHQYKEAFLYLLSISKIKCDKNI